MIDNFYLQIIAQIKSLESKKLLFERRLPVEYPVYLNKQNTRKAKRLAKKHKKFDLKIEKGYYKAISDCLSKINKVYKDILKCSEE